MDPYAKKNADKVKALIDGLKDISGAEFTGRLKLLTDFEGWIDGPELKTVYDFFSDNEKVKISDEMRCKASPFGVTDFLPILNSIEKFEDRIEVLEIISIMCYDKDYDKQKLLTAFKEGNEKTLAGDVIDKYPAVQVCPCEPCGPDGECGEYLENIEDIEELNKAGMAPPPS